MRSKYNEAHFLCSRTGGVWTLDIQVSREELSDSCRHSFMFRGTYFWVKHQQRALENLEELKVQGLLLTLAMGMHIRLGAGSHLKLLCADVFHENRKSCFETSYCPIRIYTSKFLSSAFLHLQICSYFFADIHRYAHVNI